MHGGLVTALLDEAMFYAIYAQGQTTMTVHLATTLRKSVEPGVPVRVQAQFAGQDRRYYLANAELVDLKGRLLAKSDGRFLRVPRLEAHLQGAIVEEPVP